RGDVDALTLPFEAGEVERGIGRGPLALRMPDDFAQAFEDRVQGRVLVAPCDAQPLELGPDTRRLINGELLGYGQMQREMQERIRLPALGAEVTVDEAFRLLDER